MLWFAIVLFQTLWMVLCMNGANRKIQVNEGEATGRMIHELKTELPELFSGINTDGINTYAGMAKILEDNLENVKFYETLLTGRAPDFSQLSYRRRQGCARNRLWSILSV